MRPHFTWKEMFDDQRKFRGSMFRMRHKGSGDWHWVYLAEILVGEKSEELIQIIDRPVQNFGEPVPYKTVEYKDVVIDFNPPAPPVGWVLVGDRHKYVTTTAARQWKLGVNNMWVFFVNIENGSLIQLEWNRLMEVLYSTRSYYSLDEAKQCLADGRSPILPLDKRLALIRNKGATLLTFAVNQVIGCLHEGTLYCLEQYKGLHETLNKMEDVRYVDVAYLGRLHGKTRTTYGEMFAP